MTTQKKTVVVQVPLAFLAGDDEPAKGIFRSAVVPPRYLRELTVSVRARRTLSAEPYSAAAHGPPQINIAGTSRALEALGAYLIGLARLSTVDPEPYGRVEPVRNFDGGSASLVLRRAPDVKRESRKQSGIRRETQVQKKRTKAIPRTRRKPNP